MSSSLKEYIKKNEWLCNMKQNLVTGTILLTISSLLCRFIGFFYRIFLSHTIGAEGMGIFQLIMPIYNLCFALTAAGIQTALSRMIAASMARGEHKKAIFTFFTGTILSFSLSILLSILIRTNAPFLGTNILNESRCVHLLQILSFSLPFSALHACINGWFFGVKRIKIPAVIQTIEELVRMGITYLIYLLFLKQNILLTPIIAVFGLLGGEFISVILSFFCMWNKASHPLISATVSDYYSTAKEIVKTGFPLTMNRLLLNLLHSAEAILIPFCLRKGTMDTTKSLEAFGTITGMSLPLVLFPTAIINAMSAILLPTISEKQAKNNKNAILHLVKKTTGYSVLIGILFSLLFYIFANPLGTTVYKSSEAGLYIKSLAIICPFLFINITLASVMNGLGKTFLCFSVNLVDMIIRILAICLLVPNIQIPGYIFGLVGGEIVCTLLSICIIIRISKENF